MTAAGGWQRAVVDRLAGRGTARWSAARGGAWSDAWRLDAGGCTWFVKVARTGYAGMIECEADGLVALNATATVRVPRIAAQGAAGDDAFLALEWLDLRAQDDGVALGRALAALHRAPARRGPNGERFGWHRDNWIGGAPQLNGWRDDWCTFFRDARLVPQLALLARNGHAGELQRKAKRLLDALPALLRGHAPAPSLLHGDLWSGNAATLADGTPVVFDPAVYVGDREADVAMTELFGGFGHRFHAAYDEAFPLPDGYAMRRTLYNVYHVLNHLNLFGGAYGPQAERMIDALVAHARR